MPHDCRGQVLSEGDIVSIQARVSDISNGEKDCNCKFTVVAPVGVDEKYLPAFAGNTRLGTFAATDASAEPLTVSSPIKHVLQFFRFDHLPPKLRDVSRPFAVLAWEVARGSGNAETTIALRKLLEAKDAAVRASLVGF